MSDTIGIEPKQPTTEACDFCADEETGEPTGKICNGLMTCPDCQGTKVIESCIITINASSLYARIAELEECVRELCESIVMINVSPSHYSDTCTCIDCQTIRKVDAITAKAKALIGGEKGVGT